MVYWVALAGQVQLAGAVGGGQISVTVKGEDGSILSGAVVVSAAQRTVSTTLVLKRGAAVSIRVDDPSGLLAQNEGKTPGAHLLLGVRRDALIFHSASIIAQDSAGRTSGVTIPFDAEVNVVVASSFFRLTDAAGAPFAPTGSGAIPVAVPSGQAPPILRLAVSGHR